MRKLCVATYVFGKTYQQFIPLFIYSIYKNYPEYFCVIFIDGDLDKEIAIIMEKLDFGNFLIKEGYGAEIGFKVGKKHVNCYSMALRWIIFDSIFDDFEAVYIGDIDIVLCKENPGLFEQHMAHCRLIGLPYSNAIRCISHKNGLDYRSILRTIHLLGIPGAIRSYITGEKQINRLTGLHFYITKEYLPKFHLNRQGFINKLQKITDGEVQDKNSIDGIDDQSLLYNFMLDCGFGVPKVSATGPLNDYNCSNAIGFRPHHGLHLGIFRSRELINGNIQLLNSEQYISYKKQFDYYRECDATYKIIENGFDPYIKSLIDSMDKYYTGLKGEGS